MWIPVLLDHDGPRSTLALCDRPPAEHLKRRASSRTMINWQTFVCQFTRKPCCCRLGYSRDRYLGCSGYETKMRNRIVDCPLSDSGTDQNNFVYRAAASCSLLRQLAALLSRGRAPYRCITPGSRLATLSRRSHLTGLPRRIGTSQPALWYGTFPY